ncbi:MAG TPA: thiamine phosphate synthase [Terriglobales bacterium]|nr:thiamine phosphate synthase [Terriglobales bacterium]
MPPTPDRGSPILCYVTHRRSLPLATSSDAMGLLLDTIEAVAAAGTDWIQLREKDLSGRECFELARRALQRIQIRGTATRLLVNDRLDVALSAGAGGVHLSENSLTVQDASRVRDDFFARRSVPPDFLIGVSCHSLGSALGAARGGADYIYFSPIFSTPSKEVYGPPQGVERLAHICHAVDIPVLAIGGVNAQNASQCFAAGAAGIAAIRLFQDSANLSSVVEHLHSSLPS